MMYIIPNFYRNILQCDCAIGPTMSDLKWSPIWSFIFESSIINEHDFICGFIVFIFDLSVVFRYFTILLDVIFINLRLILLTY